MEENEGGDVNHSNLRLFCERWTWNAQESRERMGCFSLSSWVLFPVNEKTYKNLLYPFYLHDCVAYSFLSVLTFFSLSLLNSL